MREENKCLNIDSLIIHSVIELPTWQNFFLVKPGKVGGKTHKGKVNVLPCANLKATSKYHFSTQTFFEKVLNQVKT